MLFLHGATTATDRYVCDGCGLVPPILVALDGSCLSCGAPARPAASEIAFARLAPLMERVLSKEEAGAVISRFATRSRAGNEPLAARPAEGREFERALEKLRAARELSDLLGVGPR